jgi:hypothetical protein
MRRFVPPLVAGVVVIAAACSDSVAPTPSTSEPQLTLASGSLAAAKKVRPPSTASVATFSIPAAGNIGSPIRVGDFFLEFPANAVCNPLTSGYGKHFWDKPCETINYDFAITATYWWEKGEAYVEFYPDIRFDPTKRVEISSYRPALVGKTGIGNYELWYWVRTLHGKARVDEARADQSVRSFFDPATGRVFRRVKHFSGISLSSGMLCDETVGDPDCVPAPIDQ